jgi:DNA-directed RNA polymerase beta' subunit
MSKLESDARPEVVEQLIVLVQLHCPVRRQLADGVSAHEGQQPPRCLPDEPPEGKLGRVQNLMGKRVNFSARSVITPTPTSPWATLSPSASP